MHIPDGFLDIKTVASTYTAAGAAGAYAVSKTKRILGEEKVPLLGVVAAFVFAAQMVNFPVFSGTSGHLMGGVLSALLVGPWAGFLVMASVLIVQALVFSDGGLTALGANIFNMGFIGTICAYWIYVFLQKIIKNKNVSVFISAWASVFLASLAVAVELSLSGYVSLKLSLVAMGTVHALIGIGEGLITIGIIKSISMVRPDLLVTESAVVSDAR